MKDKNNAFWADREIESEFKTLAYNSTVIDDEDDGSWWIDEK